MQIIIDIPEEMYQKTKEETPITYGSGSGILILHTFINAVKNGMPLPKRHGRLKDVDAFLLKVKTDRKHSAYSRSWTADDVLTALDNSYAPTIIGAESEG